MLDNLAHLCVPVFPCFWQDGSTALIEASLNGHNAVVKLLLEAGANIEAEDEVRQTHKDCFSRGFLMKIQELYVHSSSSCHLLSLSPFDGSIWTLLLTYRSAWTVGSYRFDLLMFWLLSFSLSIVLLYASKSVLSNHVLVFTFSCKNLGTTALLKASAKGRTATVKLLLDAGANKEAMDEVKWIICWYLYDYLLHTRALIKSS